MSSSGTPQSWFSQLVTFLETEARAIETKIIEMADAVGPLVVQYGEEFLSALAQIAIGAVLKQAPLAISGAEKFGAAVTHVIQQVEIQGKTLAIQDAQAIVQAAYNQVVAVANQ